MTHSFSNQTIVTSFKSHCSVVKILPKALPASERNAHVTREKDGTVLNTKCWLLQINIHIQIKSVLQNSSSKWIKRTRTAFELLPKCLQSEDSCYWTKAGKYQAHIQRLSSRRGTSTKPKELNKADMTANLPSTKPEWCLRQIQTKEKQKRSCAIQGLIIRLYMIWVFHCLYDHFQLAFSEP